MDQSDSQLYLHYGIVSLTILVGLLQAFFGQRFKKQTFFTVGAVAAGWAVYRTVQYYGPNAWDLNEVEMMVTSVSGPIVAAALGGMLLMYIEKLALFALGAGLGGYGVYTLSLLFPAMNVAAMGIPYFYTYLSYAVVGALVGALAVKLERYLITLATSAIGTILVFGGVSYFTPKMSTDYRYTFVAIMTLFAMLAFIVQLKYTGVKKTEKKDVEQNLLRYEEGTASYTDYNSVNMA